MRQFKDLQIFEKITFIAFSLSIITQFILVFTCEIEQVSDAASYLLLAQEIVDSGHWYPNTDHLYNSYIFAPGLVNYYALVLYIFETEKAILFINVILNVAICLILYKIAKKYISDATAIISLCLVSIYPTVYVMPLYTLTELPFMALSLAVIYLILSNKPIFFLGAGLLVALANWIRPVLPIMLVFVLYYVFMTQKENSRAVKSLLLFLAGTALLIGIVGGITDCNLNRFEYQSTTMGVNLIMGANDSADGRYNPIVFEKGNVGHISNADSVTYSAKDKFWKEEALKWIKENPIEWLMLFPKKVFYTFSLDYFPLEKLTGIPTSEYINSLFNKFPDYSIKDFRNVFLYLYAQSIYWFLLIMFFLALYPNIKSKNQVIISLIIYCFLFAGATLIAVGTQRYHVPYVPVVIIVVSYYLSTKPKILKLLRLT